MTDFRSLYDKAWEAGCEAAQAASPTPMTVIQRANPLDDRSKIQRSWHVPEGVCGFAWIKFKGNSKFARWCKTQSDISLSDAYPTGKMIWIGAYGQSMTRKETHARAMARVLNEGGVDCISQSRMD